MSSNDEKAANPTSRDISRHRFTFPHGEWFELVRAEWEQRTEQLRGKELHILELGSFEGASTTWILDNLMSQPKSTMTAVDTFGGGIEHREESNGVAASNTAHSINYELSSLQARFISNVEKCAAVDRLRVIKATTEQGLLQLRNENARFNFIYIDASHVALDVLHDAIMSWGMLDLYGTLVFDDFTWKGYMEHCYNPRIAIRAFLECAAPELEYTLTESQMWITKVPNHIPATKNSDPDLFYWESKEAGLRINGAQDSAEY